MGNTFLFDSVSVGDTNLKIYEAALIALFGSWLILETGSYLVWKIRNIQSFRIAAQLKDERDS